jgi:uncharacterized protein
MSSPGRPPNLPTDPSQRVHSLDILRGIALAGMFVVHFHQRSTDPGGIDDVIRILVWRLVETKSHGIFALLFGAGFAIQLRRAEARGQPFAALYLRRLVVLALFGFAAHAFFGFNVLLGYAVWAVPLLVIRSWSTRALLLTAVLSAASVSLYGLAAREYGLLRHGPDAVTAAAQARQDEARAVNDALQAAEAQGSYTVLVGARLTHMAWFYTQPFFIMPGVTLTLFVMGLLMVRHRVFDDVRAHQRMIGAMMAFGSLSWLADNWLLSEVNLFGLLRDQWLTLTYVGLTLLLLAHKPHLVMRLRAVGNAGQMALTNYLLQIACLDLLFSGYALNLGEVRPVVGLPAALTCFAVEAVCSTVWLRLFRFGPAEWLWRSLTYGRLQPMRRATLPSMAAPAVE